jgi:[ribosomal protein S18]-alanine N-acetyltransferase
MIRLLRRLFARPPVLTPATMRDIPAIASLHAVSFRRGWSDEEIDTLLRDRHVTADRVLMRGKFVGFIMSRHVAGEAEILSIAISAACRGRGFARDLLTLHLRRLAGQGCRTVFLEVDEQNTAAIRLYDRAGFREISRRPNYYPAAPGKPGGKPAAALILRRDLA